MSVTLYVLFGESPTRRFLSHFNEVARDTWESGDKSPHSKEHNVAAIVQTPVRRYAADPPTSVEGNRSLSGCGLKTLSHLLSSGWIVSLKSRTTH